jgi:uncharacterized protein (DUF2147 family)
VSRNPKEFSMHFAHITRLAGSAAMALLAAAALPATAAPNKVPGGIWVTESGNLEVELTPCGPALCGTVVTVLANRSMSGPGAELVPADARPALGLTLLSGFKPSGEGQWTGQIYNRENGKTYSARMTQPTADQLVIRAYVGLPLFGKTQVWRRSADSAPAAQK